MSHPSRPQARGPAQRPRRRHEIESPERLETLQLPAPVVSSSILTAVFTPATTPTNEFLGTVSITSIPKTASAAPITSVTQFAANSQFGGDIVRIKAGPGGVFGNDVYAISRGAGENIDPNNRAANTPDPINRPGVIYRLDPATGKASVFFDLNSVISQIEPGATSSNSISSTPAANGVSTASGLLNWYDITFDPEGYFNGKPSMFVSTVDASDPNKNAIYQIGPDGSLMGVFVKYTAGGSTQQFTQNPTAILVPPIEQQNFLRGLFASSGAPGVNGLGSSQGNNSISFGGSNLGFEAVFFDANKYSPGQNIVGTTLPTGANPSPFVFGPQVGITAANTNYASPEYSAFTDFGTPAATGVAAAPGLSGVDGITDSNGSATNEFGTGLISYRNAGAFNFAYYQVNFGLTPASVTTITTQATVTNPSGVDGATGITSTFRRFQDIAFDQYGYFSSNVALGSGTTGGTGTGTGSGGSIQTGQTSQSGDVLPFAGSVFVSDLGTGLAVSVTPITPTGSPITFPAIPVPIQGGGAIGVQLPDTTNGQSVTTPIVTNGNTTGGSNLGGRIVRIDANGTLDVFAQNFHTSGSQGSDSFYNSSLTISFSADGTTLYASDDDGIWQFKTTASLAGSTSGSIVGLNDLRTLGVPYDGLGTAVAVLDSGVDGSNPSFRGRVSSGTNLLTNGLGNQDTAPGIGSATGGATVAGPVTTGGTTSGTTSTTTGFADGHGTLVAGVVAQFVPQATIEPVAIFSPTLTVTSSSGGTTGGTGGSTTTTSTLSTVNTSPQLFYQGLQYVADHPFVGDPVRPNSQDRVIATTLAIGTTRSFQNEVDAYKLFPQFTLSVKNQLLKLRKLGITPIGSAGQFSTEASPNGSGSSSTGGSTGGTTGGTTTSVAGLGDPKGMSLPSVLNEVLSVTGTYSFPLTQTANSTPLNNVSGLAGRVAIPILLGPLNFNANSSTGSTGSSTAGSGNSLSALVQNDATVFKDKLLGSANRSITTDYAAPALDVPTFRRTVSVSVNNASPLQSLNTRLRNDPADLVYQQGGTSLSAGIVAGSFALTASALDYWDNLYQSGSTEDHYLTTPVGARSLNYGAKALTDLSAYSTPDGVNAILQWTAVPAVDDPNTYADALAVTSSSSGGSTGGTTGGTGGSTTGGFSTPTVPTLFGSATPRSYSRVSVGNAIAAIEGTEALNYLIKNNTLSIIDSNKDGLITAAEVQTFVDNSSAMGLAEAGSMARLLGGTARIPGVGDPTTGAGETPDQPDVLQRRFNFFDYAANGRLAGVISISDLKTLSQRLLPQPDTFTITDRQRSSQTNYLLDPTQPRASKDLQHKLPTAMFIPARKVAQFRGISPNAFHIGRFQGRTVNPFSTGPSFTLYGDTSPTTITRTTRVKATAHAKAASTATPPATVVLNNSAKTTTTTTTSATTAKTPVTPVVHQTTTTTATVTTPSGSSQSGGAFSGVPTALSGASTAGSLTTPADATSAPAAPTPTTTTPVAPTPARSKISTLIAKPKTDV